MATDSVHKIDAYTVAAAAESQNRERNSERRNRRVAAKEKAAPPSPTKVTAEIPAVDLGSSQIVDSSTVVELLAHRPNPNPQARFLRSAPTKTGPERLISVAKKLDRSA